MVASFVMAGGVLTGKYDAGQTGRAASDLFSPRFAEAREKGLALHALAQEVGVSAGALAIAFALANPAVATVLFGATSPEQIAENVTRARRRCRDCAAPGCRLRPARGHPPIDQKARDRDRGWEQQLGVVAVSRSDE